MSAKPVMRVSGVKAAIAVVAIACAVASLAVLQTASPVATNGPGSERSAGASSLERGTLGR